MLTKEIMQLAVVLMLAFLGEIIQCLLSVYFLSWLVFTLVVGVSIAYVLFRKR